MLKNNFNNKFSKSKNKPTLILIPNQSKKIFLTLKKYLKNYKKNLTNIKTKLNL